MEKHVLRIWVYSTVSKKVKPQLCLLKYMYMYISRCFLRFRVPRDGYYLFIYTATPVENEQVEDIDVLVNGKKDDKVGY